MNANHKKNIPLITAARADHLPIIAQYLRQLRLVEIINELVPLKMAVEPGIIVLGVVLDTLSGRSPLYHLEKAFEDYDQELLFGRDLPPGYFNDDNVGRVFDALFAVGTKRIFSALSASALQNFSLSTRHVHFDTTSVNVFGDYDDAASQDDSFKITHGYSKDKRPDLKQFVLSLLCVGGNVPIVGKVEDGNASDKTINHRVLSDVSQHMAEHGVNHDAFVYVADSAMVTERNLAQADLFITRLPATYSECAHAIQSAVDADQWIDIGSIAVAPPTKKRPNASYKVHETIVTLYGKSYRAIVVHSSAHDKRRHKRLERELAASLKEADTLAASFMKKHFYCHADAEQTAQELAVRVTQFHQFNVEIIECPRYARGRPAQGVKRTPAAIEYKLLITIIEREKLVTQREDVAGCFVLLSSVPTDWNEGYDAEKILRTYKDQYGIENNFGFLKDDQIVNAIFLKRPERIEVLGLMLLISLLVWRLIEHTMRTELEASDSTLSGWDNKPTQRPTAYMMRWKFRGIIVLRIGEERQLARPLSVAQEAFLKALKMPLNCFTEAPLA